MTTLLPKNRIPTITINSCYSLRGCEKITKISENMEVLQLVISTVFACCLTFSWTGAMAVELPVLPKQILVFGGNGMIGSALVEKLIPLEHKLVLVNRGSYYWDTAFTIYPYIQHIGCDRWQKLEKCQGFMDYLNNVHNIDVVIDFSAYQPEALENALDVLNGKAKLYIYISSDSVYEVCTKNHSMFTLETDAVRPISREEQESLNSLDAYGHQKLQGEEILYKKRKEGTGPSFISFRLPDVTGPRDNTLRWWTYQLWMKLQPFLEKQIAVPSELRSKPLSFVYVNDVADLIFNLVENPVQEAFDEAFNLAFAETPTLSTVLNGIKTELNLTELNIHTSGNSDTIKLFPSVHLGPINISKAEDILNWKPTSWKKALKETIQFYENAIKDIHFDNERKQMIRKFQSYFTSKPNNVIHGLIDIYGLRLPKPRDEL